jgi:GntR family transcriptional regulator of vanillate catabolism
MPLRDRHLGAHRGDGRLGEGSRAQAIAEEHVQVAKRNVEYALERPERAAMLLPALGLMAG